MKIEKTPSGGMTIVLEPSEVPLMRFTLERAMFVDTPPDRQEEILRFAEDLLKGLTGGASGR